MPRALQPLDGRGGAGRRGPVVETAPAAEAPVVEETAAPEAEVAATEPEAPAAEKAPKRAKAAADQGQGLARRPRPMPSRGTDATAGRRAGGEGVLRC